MSITSVATALQLAPAEACPSWCAYASEPSHRSAFGETHVGTEAEVPVLPHWWCAGARGTASDCADTQQGIVAYLLKYDGEQTAVGLRHGDDVLPYVDPDAAEELGRALLELARRARAA